MKKIILTTLSISCLALASLTFAASTLRCKDLLGTWRGNLGAIKNVTFNIDESKQADPNSSNDTGTKARISFRPAGVAAPSSIMKFNHLEGWCLPYNGVVYVTLSDYSTKTRNAMISLHMVSLNQVVVSNFNYYDYARQLSFTDKGTLNR